MEYSSLTAIQAQIYTFFQAYSYIIYALLGAIALWEVAARLINKKMSWHYAIDSLSSLLTVPLIGVLGYLMTLIGMGSVFALGYPLYNEYAVYQMGWSWGSLALVLLATDFWYYWTHRAFHRINSMWTTHTVHHSSDYINIPMAVRFGPLDGFFMNLTHLPLAFFFEPGLIVIGIVVNQAYQGVCHTDRIHKLPNWFEYLFNTPSNHRVHHGSNPQYIDKNYAGILMCWDRWFGTFEPEKEEVRYGIVKPLKSQDPITVLFHGYWRFGVKLSTVRSFSELWKAFLMPPEWQTEKEKQDDTPMEGAPVESEVRVIPLPVPTSEHG